MTATPLPRTDDAIGGVLHTDLWDFDGLAVGMTIRVTLRTSSRRPGSRPSPRTYTGEIAWVGRGTSGRILSIKMHTGTRSGNRDLRWISRLPSSTISAEVVA
jgi:hypothetical protein